MTAPLTAKAESDTTPTRSEYVVILGDSNIWLAGDSCDNHKGWMAWFRDLWQPASCRSYARSGASWSHTVNTRPNTVENIAVLGDDNVIYNQVQRLIDARGDGSQATPTLIMIAAGGNDGWFAHRRPLEFTQSVSDAFEISEDSLLSLSPDRVLSLPGAIRRDCVALRRAFPHARIVLLTSTPMLKVDPAIAARVAALTEQTGLRLGIPTVRLDRNGPIKREQEAAAYVNTYDGTHTSERGAEAVGRYVSERVKALIYK